MPILHPAAMPGMLSKHPELHEIYDGPYGHTGSLPTGEGRSQGHVTESEEAESISNHDIKSVQAIWSLT